MTEIIDYIDHQIKTCIGEARCIGLCHQIDNEEGNVYPTQFKRRSEMVTPDDRFNITIYHRLVDGDIAPREDVPFGRNVVPLTEQTIRTVVFVKMELGHDVILDIINSLPNRGEIDGFKNMVISKEISLSRNQKEIWEDEYGNNYDDKYIKLYLIYALEYNVQFVKCNVCTV